jgi:putative ABC transport system permease protein
MGTLKRFWRRLLFLRHRNQLDSQLQEEMQFHLEMKIEENLAAGMSAEEARYQALRQFGNQTIMQENAKEVWNFVYLETFLQDIRFAFRMLRKNPVFTIVAVLALSLGIGANTAIFSVITTVLVRPLPYQEPERLVWLANTNPSLGVSQTFLNPEDILDFREQAESFEQVASWGTYPVNLAGGKEPERVESIYVTTNFFETLGIAPVLGRDFTGEDGKEGSTAVIISYGLWQRQFGGDPDIIGRNIVLAGNAQQPRVIVGVMPAGMLFPSHVDLFETYQLERTGERGGTHNDRTIARLKPGKTVEQAQADVNVIALRQAEQFPATNKGWGVAVVPFREHLFGSANVALPLLFGAVAFVLLIAWTNVTGLQLARATSRQKEIAIRLALGAGRWRIVRQMLVESLILSLFGGAIGLVMAWWGIDVLRALGAETLPRLKDTALDIQVLAFTTALSIFTGVIFGVIPALQATKPNLNQTLKDTGSASIGGSQPHRFRSLLVISQFAMAMVLLVGAGLLIKSFWKLQQASPGFQSEQVIAAGVSLNMEEYRDTAKRRQFYEQELSRVAALPGVESAAATSHLPFGGRTLQQNFRVEGQEPVSKQNRLLADYRVITPTFFETMRIRLNRGRNFTEQDTTKAPIVYVINEAFAHTYLSGSDVVGRRIRLGYEGQWLGEIVGIVEDVKHRTMEADAVPTIYASYLQCEPLPSFPIMNYVVRTRDTSGKMMENVRRELQSVNGNQVIFYVKPMADFVADTTAQRRFHMLLLAIFAGVALTLSAVGIYGLMSYLVTERRREMGIRIALGAVYGDVLRLVIGQGMKLALIGLLIGAIGALTLVRLLQSLLYGVSTTDIFTFLTVAVILMGVALVACLVPARRAAKTDPIIALRYE